MNINNLHLTLQPAAEDLLQHVLPQVVFKIGDIEITNHMVMIALTAFVVFLVFALVGLKARKNLVPTGIHNLFEAVLSFLRTELVRPALGENADKFTPFIWTVFFFILFGNLLGMIPVNEIIGISRGGIESHLWGTATANIIITAGLAVVAFVVVHISGITQQIRIQMDPSLAPHHHGNDHTPPHGHGQMMGAEGIEDERDVVLDHKVGDGHDHAHGMHHSQEFGGAPFPIAFFKGIGNYLWNFAPHPDVGNPVANVFMFLGLLVLEFMGSLVKPFSLCIRLFANMVAGHLVLGALVGMITLVASAAAVGGVSIVVIAGCTALSLLELFVAFLQAYIFTFLTTLFIASAIAPEH